MTPSLAIASVSLAASLAALLVALFRRHTAVERDLHARLDNATEEARRLGAEVERLAGELKAARLKLATGTVLADIARQAVAYAEQLGGTPAQKRAHALQAARRLDSDDNGSKDYTDAQFRIAFESAVRELGASPADYMGGAK